MFIDDVFFKADKGCYDEGFASSATALSLSRTQPGAKEHAACSDDLVLICRGGKEGADVHKQKLVCKRSNACILAPKWNARCLLILAQCLIDSLLVHLWGVGDCEPTRLDAIF